MMIFPIILAWLSGHVAETRFALIANPSVHVTNLSLAEVRQVFQLERRFWSSGNKVVVLLPGERLSARRPLLARVYHATEDELKRLILERLYQGESDAPPKTSSGYEELVAFTAAAPGAITVVPLDLVPATGVNVIRIDGKLPGEPGYPLVP